MTGWTVSRLMSVDRSLLRLAVYEMLYCGHIAPKGAIDEAIAVSYTHLTGGYPGGWQKLWLRQFP